MLKEHSQIDHSHIRILLRLCVYIYINTFFSPFFYVSSDKKQRRFGFRGRLKGVKDDESKVAEDLCTTGDWTRSKMNMVGFMQGKCRSKTLVSCLLSLETNLVAVNLTS